MDVAITGASGLIGSALSTALRARGDAVVTVGRGADADVRWDPMAGTIDTGSLDGVHAVVHLAGESLGEKKWTDEQKRKILESRVRGTELIATTIAELAVKPAVLVSGSAVGFYGDRGDEELTEASGAGSDGFLPLVTARWEASTRAAEEAGVRVVHLRTALVLSASGGLLPRVLTPFRFGLGATLGSGRAYWSFLTLHDAVAAIRFLAERPEASGAYNLSAPTPVHASEFTRALATAVGRPAWLRLPVWALRVGVGQMGPEVLGSLRVLPERLTAAGFRFRDGDVETAVRMALRDER